MKKKARITSKGQITVPHEIRRAMGVRPGDSLVFEQKGSEFRVTPVRTVSPFKKFRGIGNPGIPTGRKGIIRYIRKMRGYRLLTLDDRLYRAAFPRLSIIRL